MSAIDIEYAVIFHNTCPQSREAELVLERIRKRFGLSSDRLSLLAQGSPVVVKRAPEVVLAKKLKDMLLELGAVAWVQRLQKGQEYGDRRGQKRRQQPDRRSAYRHNLSIPERRFGGGRRRSDIGMSSREYWRGLVV
ncbi:hypothetical protein [uncultured Pseudoteredinibacter sp.]|uniref:hypothetical protein n=1 Tax=uncultured Pseudoteredinibacter sp. TaxID=1641701 RepID=UPI002607B45E|nr:hypothetical protein [uncultured Pseudoteredinibacter sp.]